VTDNSNLPPWMATDGTHPGDEFVKPIGEFATAFGWLDFQLDLALISLLNVESLEWANAILSQIPNFEPRIDLFSQLAHLTFKEGIQEQTIKEITKELDDINGKRNRIIHGKETSYVWPPLKIGIKRTRPKSEKYGWETVFYSPEDILKMVDQIYATGAKLGQFKFKINEYLLHGEKLRT
jgi:hypothetical protein